MANTKISALTANTNPNWWEELVYAYNNANGKMTLNTMKTFANTWQQEELVSGTNIKTINGNSILWSWNLVISWWGGGWWDSAYDAVVDAGWGGDYTLVSAAIAAGKYNIFVKNWTYTETAWRDPYSNSKSKLRIVWESESGVQITFPSTATTAHSYLIDMRYGNAADFYMENISFDITLTSSNTRFYSDNGGSNCIVKNCSFTYTTNVATPTDTTHYLFYSKVIDDSSNAREAWRVYSWFFGCYFNTETTKVINISYNVFVGEMCKLYSSAWRIQLVSSTNNAKLYNCFVDAYELWGLYELESYNSYINVTTWNVYDGNWYNLRIPRIDSSIFKMGTLQNTPTISLWECTDTELDFGSYDISWSITFNNREATRSNSRITCADLNTGNNMMWCDISATSLKTSWYCRIIWNRFRNTLTSVTFNQNNGIIEWNYFAASTWSVTISWNYNIFTGNNMSWMSLTDSGTWTQKANNVTSA